ncbi:MAG TPA: hypothetical protein VEJ45_06370 [Candidatus Acidoferrales bacterium]|nr:hypothetical protein [Candidatus Acidoferrales bacterium]
MNRPRNVLVWAIVGFCGGILAPHVLGKAVHAEELRRNAKVVTAQKFVLTNEQGTPAGIFGFDTNGSPEITLLDAQGDVVWSTKLRMQTLSR